MDSATISECGRYRYDLTRDLLTIADAGPVLFVMLNPSTADASQDDPTIRRCIGFAKRFRCDRLTVANLYALRSPRPKDLWAADDPVGPENDSHLRRLLSSHDLVVCAWGANAECERVKRFAEIADECGANLWCLGTTKAGAPLHPLYLRKDTELRPWSPARDEQPK